MVENQARAAPCRLAARKGNAEHLIAVTPLSRGHGTVPGISSTKPSDLGARENPRPFFV
jgi:hypothetical protein